MCARVAIDLKLFNIIADAKRPISSAELATETGAEEQLIGMKMRSNMSASKLTVPQFASFVDSQFLVLLVK
jgi:hypothetical protein